MADRLFRQLGRASVGGVVLGTAAQLALVAGWAPRWPFAPEPRHMIVHMDGQVLQLIERDMTAQYAIWAFIALCLILATACNALIKRGSERG